MLTYNTRNASSFIKRDPGPPNLVSRIIAHCYRYAYTWRNRICTFIRTDTMNTEQVFLSYLAHWWSPECSLIFRTVVQISKRAQWRYVHQWHAFHALCAIKFAPSFIVYLLEGYMMYTHIRWFPDGFMITWGLQPENLFIKIIVFTKAIFHTFSPLGQMTCVHFPWCMTWMWYVDVVNTNL